MSELRLSQHALERMRQRGITVDQVQWIVHHATPFRYCHAGSWQTGYYDSRTRIFVAEVDNMVTTVMTNVAPNYVEGLRRAPK